LKVAGIDLAAKENRCTGYASIDVDKSMIIDVLCLYSDDNIVNKIINDRIAIAAIDAPIIKNPRMRNVDRAMIRRGFKVFPPNFSWMKLLSTRAFRISNILHRYGVKIIETHPRSALINSKCKDAYEVLKLLGISIGPKHRNALSFNRNLADAVICACVAYLHVKGNDEVIVENDGSIHLIRPLCECNDV